MENIKEIVKKTLLMLKKKSLEATPDNYFAEFYIQAQKYKGSSKECEIFDDILEKSNIDKNSNIKNFSQLALKLLDENKNSGTKKGLQKLAVGLHDILAPSVQYDIEDQIDDISKILVDDPQKLLQRDTVETLKSITKQRIQNDRKIVRDKAEDIVKLTSLLSKHFETTIISSDNSSNEILNIKKELEELEISSASARELSVLQTKLVDTMCNFESVVQNHKLELIKEQENISNLEETVYKLQKELNTAHEERILDYLTNVLNRRAFDGELEKIEKKHKIFNSKYAIVFYDIDHFKNINDTYGHECGDAVLRTFAAILKNLTRQEDVVARYGGEEFVVLLNYENIKEITKYIKRVKELIKNSEFNYKENNLEIKFSAGVACRDNHDTHFEAITKADELLYSAKNGGRDRVLLENGTVL